MDKKIIIYIIDDEEHVRNAIALLIESVGFKVKKFSSALEFFEQFDADPIGCIISDIRMPIMGGMDVLKKLNKEFPSSHLPVILITGHGDVAMAVQAMKNGALDFVEKPFDNQNLLDKVNQAVELSVKNREENEATFTVQDKYSTLTEKEKQVFELIAKGDTNKLISEKLYVTQSTIEARRAKIILKMDAKNVSELIKMSVIVGPS
ncbi:MAG: response regulator [Candidatus Thioglobus sp.]|nr:response regulator [Candidatus Thioglobus sp.]